MFDCFGRQGIRRELTLEDAVAYGDESVREALAAIKETVDPSLTTNKIGCLLRVKTGRDEAENRLPNYP